MINDLKTMITDEASLEEKLELIVSDTTARLRLLLGGIEPPDEMNHIIREVSNIRFNRIGSEGVTVHSVEGESMHFTNDDFGGFMGEIQAWLDSQKESKRGKVRFL